MPNVKISKLDDRKAEPCRARTIRAGCSLAERLRQCRTERARVRRKRFIVQLARLNAKLREKYGELPDSTPLIREERDRYG